MDHLAFHSLQKELYPDCFVLHFIKPFQDVITLGLEYDFGKQKASLDVFVQKAGFMSI